jgi:hypothetical protein
MSWNLSREVLEVLLAYSLGVRENTGMSGRFLEVTVFILVLRRFEVLILVCEP